MGRRTELGASPWKTDTRTVQEWLEFSERELRKISKVLGPPRTGRDLDERLGLLADGKTDSVVVRVEASIRRAGWVGVGGGVVGVGVRRLHDGSCEDRKIGPNIFRAEHCCCSSTRVEWVE